MGIHVLFLRFVSFKSLPIGAHLGIASKIGNSSSSLLHSALCPGSKLGAIQKLFQDTSPRVKLLSLALYVAPSDEKPQLTDLRGSAFYSFQTALRSRL